MKTTDIGIVTIQLRRGNNKAITLAFFDVAVDNSQKPKDLRIYNAIRMDIKKTTDVNSPVIESFAIGTGLAIIGEDFNILKITFAREFIEVNEIQYVYDILFREDQDFANLIGGSININNTVTI
jgi:hypothetical protein